MTTKPTPWTNRIVGHGEVPPGELVPNPGNWRRHSRAQRRALAKLLRTVGWVRDVIVNRRTGLLIDGHLRVLLAIENGEETIPVLYVDLDEAEEALVLATLDPIAAMAGADLPALESLQELISTSDEEVLDLLEETRRQVSPGPRTSIGTEDRADPLLPPRPVSVRADTWLLGDHLVMCGNATSPADVSALLAGRRAASMWTDPPYGVDYRGKTPRALDLRNDDAEGLPRLLRDAFAAADEILMDGASIYVAHPSGALSLVFGHAFLDAGWHLHQTLVWLKDAFVVGHSDYHYRHEPILYGWKGTNRRWFGDRSQDSVFEVPRPRRSEQHPTAKPVALVEAQLLNSTATGSLVYDPSRARARP